MTKKTAVLLSLLLVAACDRWLTNPPLYNTVQVVAARRNGDPIPGVDFVLYTGQRPMGYGVTGPDGHLTFPNVPQGLYGVLGTPPAGYDVIENLIGGPSSLVVDNLNVADDTVSPVRFTLLKRGPGAVTVRVVQSSDGSPIAGAVVTAYGPNKVDSNATTDANGHAVFSAIPFGVHGVVVTRPLLYRIPGDSLYSIHDGIIVEDGSRDSVVFKLQKCVGTVQALVLDDAGTPVPATTAVFYTATDQLALSATGADGRVTFTQAPCAEVGVFITPAPGYSVQPGRGTQFIDGIKVTNGATLTVTFRVQKTR